MITIERHRLLRHTPLFPRATIVRTRGAVNQTAWVCLWLWWALNVELSGSRGTLKKPAARVPNPCQTPGVAGQSTPNLATRQKAGAPDSFSLGNQGI